MQGRAKISLIPNTHIIIMFHNKHQETVINVYEKVATLEIKLTLRGINKILKTLVSNIYIPQHESNTQVS